MQRRNLKGREPAEAVHTEQLLTGHYSRLLQWATVLTRGDTGKAEEIVQEFCLYIALTRPDLSHVVNLDGYLYTSLRHIYLSSLSRASREAMQLVSIEEFDSFAFAVSANSNGDPLQRQNDLRRICAFVVWRKETSKSASYFILHFFHGYARREIAELARLPMSAIYNKLKTARTEVRSYLEEHGKLRVVNRNQPPEPSLSWILLSSIELFKELRASILAARATDCLPEEELLAHYRSGTPQPISCALLAHIVSCERCLSLVDHHFRRPTLKDREPLDALGSGSDVSDNTPVPGNIETAVILRSVHRWWGRIFEHRPRTLSIAVNGQIVAFHDVRAEHNKLSARLEYAERVQFVEVFSEQDVRLALLPVGQPPPEGPELQTQRVALSDARWLELSLAYDGLGMHTEVAYFDPALAIAAEEEDAGESVFVTNPDAQLKPSGFLAWIESVCTECAQRAGAILSPPAWAWALTLIILLSTAGYLAFRHMYAPMDAAQILHESIRMENASLEGQTEHQVLQIEETSADGRVLQQGTVDLWKDGDGSRYARRLYNMQHHMIAEKWRDKHGDSGARGDIADGMNGLWDQDLSAQGFAALGGSPPQVRQIPSGYEITSIGPGPAQPHLVSATLVLDHHLRPLRQTIRVREGTETRELHFVQVSYEREPTASVPDTVFDPNGKHLSADGSRHSLSGRQHGSGAPVSDGTQLAELQIAVLYQLHKLGADTGAPIEVVRTPQGRLRVSGTVNDDALKQAIFSHLHAQTDHQLIDLRLLSPTDLQHGSSGIHRSRQYDASVYEINQTGSPAEETLRKYFSAKGLSGDRLDSAMAKFSQDALQLAQHSLQDAYALDRLGSVLSFEEFHSISAVAQQQWVELVAAHAANLEQELTTLRGQLAQISPPGAEQPVAGGGLMAIEDPAQFERAAGQLLRQARELNRQIGEFFTANASTEGLTRVPPLATTIDTIPLHQAAELAQFAGRLAGSAAWTQVNREHKEDDKSIPNQAR
jgi:DNA-directed RNA polymerase specialized sigma24 family protein